MPRILRKLNVHCPTRNSLPVVAVMNQINPVQALPSYLFMIRFNIIISSCKWCLSLRFVPEPSMQFLYLLTHDACPARFIVLG